MKTTLPAFYLAFLFFTAVLFSFEDRRVNHSDSIQKSEGQNELKENANKEEKKIKRPFKHYYRYSNLC